MERQGIGSSIIQSILEGVNSGIEEDRLKKKKKRELSETSDLLLDQKMKENQALFDQRLKQSEQALPSKLAELKQVSDFNFNQAQEQKKKKRESLIGKIGQDGKYSGGSLSDILNANPRRAQAILAAMDGIKVPMPALPDVAKLTAQGKYQEAWDLSDDPIDREHVLAAVKFHNAVNGGGSGSGVISQLASGDVKGALEGIKSKKDLDAIATFRRITGASAGAKSGGSSGGSKARDERGKLPVGMRWSKEDPNKAERIPGTEKAGRTTDEDAKELRRLERLAKTYEQEADEFNDDEESKKAAREELKKINARKREILTKASKPAPVRDRGASMEKLKSIFDKIDTIAGKYRKGEKF